MLQMQRFLAAYFIDLFLLPSKFHITFCKVLHYVIFSKRDDAVRLYKHIVMANSAKLLAIFY